MDVEFWKILAAEPEDFAVEMKIENSTQPKLILFMENFANTPTTQTFSLGIEYLTFAPHKYAIGSLKLWYSDDDFSDGSTMTLDVFVTSMHPKSMEELKEPCLTMNIPHPKRQTQPNFEYIYFGDIHDSQNLNFLNFFIKVQLHSHKSPLTKPKSLALRDLTFHLTNELHSITYSQAECPLGQVLGENLICQDCAANCDGCFGTKPSQCFSCSKGCHWWDSECLDCHDYCRNCTGPTQHECLSCNFGFFNYENGTCSDMCDWPFHNIQRGSEYLCQKACKSDQYAFKYNATCLTHCPIHFVPSTDNNGILTCDSPCSNHSDFLYMNGSCISVCPAPFIQETHLTLKLCTNNLCQSKSFSISSSQSCLDACVPPLQIRSHPLGYSCVNPCDSEDFYLYNNGSCSSDCPDPLGAQIERGVKFCRNPCRLSSDYLYFNRSCLKECPAPLQVRSEPGVKYCENPCHSTRLYLLNNGSCLAACPAPLVAVFDTGVTLCRNPCKLPSDYLSAHGTCLKECPAPLQIRSESIANFCVNPCHSTKLYLYTNGSCSSVCPSPLVPEFQSQSWTRFCRNPCSSKSDYLYANKSCLKECPAPLQVRSEPIANFCVNPCPSTKLYLYQNGSCLSTCPFPGRIKEVFGVKYCGPPCSLTEEFILKDGSCSKACPVPLVRKTEESIGTFCLTPCDSDDHFISKNDHGSALCLLNCPASFETKIEYGVRYCINPCSSQQYYFDQNNSCLTTCPYPLKIPSEEELHVCKNPCLESNSFLYDDQSCHEGCPVPFIMKEGNYCKSPCQKENEYVDVNGDCQETCEYPYTVVKKGSYQICIFGLSLGQSIQIDAMRETIKISNTLTKIGGVLSSLIHPGDPTSILMAPLLDMFQKIIYIEITLPGNTELILLNQLSLGQGQRRLLSESTIEAELQQVKVYAQLQSTFDDKVVKMAIFSVIALLISGLLQLARPLNESKLYQLVVKLDLALRWNTLIPLFISLSGDIVFFSLIEFQKLHLNSLRGILGILLTTFVLYKIFIMSRRREMDFQRWRFLFEIFSENHKCFILIFFLRMILFHLIIGLLYNSPHFQPFGILLMNFGMSFYLSWLSPVQKTINKTQYLIIESALLFYNLIFGILTVFGFSDGSVTGVFGQLMNILYLITSVLTAFIIIVRILQIIYHHYQTCSPSAPSHANQIQLSEMNQESDLDSPPESIHFEALNQVEMNSEEENHFGKFLLILELIFSYRLRRGFH